MIDDDGSIESKEIKSSKLDQAKKQWQFVLNNGHGALPIGNLSLQLIVLNVADITASIALIAVIVNSPLFHPSLTSLKIYILPRPILIFASLPLEIFGQRCARQSRRQAERGERHVFAIIELL